MSHFQDDRESGSGEVARACSLTERWLAADARAPRDAAAVLIAWLRDAQAAQPTMALIHHSRRARSSWSTPASAAATPRSISAPHSPPRATPSATDLAPRESSVRRRAASW